MQVYDVTVRFSRTIQVREYEPATAEVTVKAQIAEGEQADQAVAASFKLVSDQVHLALGLPADTKLPKRGQGRATAEATPAPAAAKTEAPKPAAQTQAQPQQQTQAKPQAPASDIPDDGAPSQSAQAAKPAAGNDDIPDSVPANVPTGQQTQSQPAAFEQLTAAELSKWIGEQVRLGKVSSAAITSLYPKFGISRFADLKPEKCGEAKAAIEQLIQGGAAL